jgi:hypothetical protein
MLDESTESFFVSVKLEPSAADTCAALGHVEVDVAPPPDAPVVALLDDPLVAVLAEDVAEVLDALDDDEELLPQAVTATDAPTATTASARCVGLTDPPGSAPGRRRTVLRLRPLTPIVPWKHRGFRANVSDADAPVVTRALPAAQLIGGAHAPPNRCAANELGGAPARGSQYAHDDHDNRNHRQQRTALARASPARAITATMALALASVVAAPATAVSASVTVAAGPGLVVVRVPVTVATPARLFGGLVRTVGVTGFGGRCIHR